MPLHLRLGPVRDWPLTDRPCYGGMSRHTNRTGGDALSKALIRIRALGRFLIWMADKEKHAGLLYSRITTDMRF